MPDHDPVTRVAAKSTTGTITFTFDSSDSPWSTAELAVLESWTASSSPQMAAVYQVVGRPLKNLSVNIVKAPVDGTYDWASSTMKLPWPIMSTFLHETTHAVRGAYLLNQDTWEEGTTRAAEIEQMTILAALGIREDGYNLFAHSYPFSLYYDNANVSSIGAPGGEIWNTGAEALALQRYEQAGYAFGKLLIENPGVLRAFNAQLFTLEPGVWRSQDTLSQLLSSVQPFVESTPTALWLTQQHIFDTEHTPGCRLSHRPGEFAVAFVCLEQTGWEVAQVGARVRLDIYDHAGLRRYTSTVTTDARGIASFDPAMTGSYARLKAVATRITGPAAPPAIYYTSDTTDPHGLFGVVVGASTGTVTASSPVGKFETVMAPVTKGGFNIPAMETTRGPVELTFAGEGLTSTRLSNKDASSYSTVLVASTTATQCSVPGPATQAVDSVGTLTATTPAQVPLVTTWTASKGQGCSYELQKQNDNGTWTTLTATTALSHSWTAPVGLVPAFRVRAFDTARRPSGRAISIMSTIDVAQETAAFYSGTFTSTGATADWGGSSRTTTAAQSSATFTFDGRSAAVIGRTGKSYGAFAVYVDGTRMPDGNEYSSGATVYRQIVARWTGASGSHTLKVVNIASGGHAGLAIDGFISSR